jgi:hypothetical protein
MAEVSSWVKFILKGWHQSATSSGHSRFDGVSGRISTAVVMLLRQGSLTSPTPIPQRLRIATGLETAKDKGREC